MSVSSFHPVPKVPDSVAHLDPDVVVEVLSRHAVNVSEAADELGVGSADLRRLLWARPQLADAAVEIEERRLDLAERNIYEALKSDDPRRRDAASMFTFRWRSPEDDRRDAERAEAERLRDEGKPVVSIGWGDAGKTIEHEANPEPSNKD
jgi:hypothetical protein